MVKELMKFEKILDFEKILLAIAKKGDTKVHIKRDNKFSPTELSGCIRSSYYNRVYPIEYDDKTYMNFLYENILHELFQDHLDFKVRDKVLKDVIGDNVTFTQNEKEFHYLIPLEKTNNERIIISGRLDTIIFLKDNPIPIVVDYKTTGAIKYSSNAPKETHVSQLNYYLGCMLADYGILVYINKPDLKIVQHTVKWSPEIFNEMIDFAITLKDSLDKKIPPDVNIKDMQSHGYCAYCKNKDKCKELNT